jgi:outer membrane protein assembly factor BamB
MMTTRTRRQFIPERFPWLCRWWISLVILTVGWSAIVAVHAGWLRFSIRPALDFLVLLAATNFLFYAWVRACSQWRMDRQLIAIAAVVAAQAGLHQMVRLDGFAGDGRPRWVGRWTPVPPTAADWERHRKLPLPLRIQEVPVDLTEMTPLDSPGFRGCNRDGCAVTVSLDSDLANNAPKLLWRQPVGLGWSSFAVVGQYCVTQEQRGEQEATVCYELRTGRERWVHFEQAQFDEPTSGEGPRATPAIHNGKVYSLGATGILNCLAGATGQPIWTVDILKDNATTNLRFGITASPLVCGNMVIVNPGGKGSSLAAYDLDSGKRIWRGGTAGASYSSPQPARLCGRDQVLDFNAEGLFAHDLLSGEVQWSVPWISNPAERNNVCQPVVLPAAATGEPDSVFIASGYGMGCALLEVRKDGEQLEVSERWRNRNLKAKFSSVIVHEGFAYGLDDAILTCVDISSGERRWKAGRYGYGQLILAGSTLLIQAESGDVALVKAAPDSWRELGRFAALSGRTWNHPVVAGRFLLVRNDREAACYELSGK